MLSAREAVRMLSTYHPPLGGRNGLRLDFNENTVGCSPRVLERLRQIGVEELARYPEREPLEAVVAGYLKVKPEELLLTNGGDDALRVFFDTFAETGTHILICEPTFPMYRYYAEIAGTRVKALQYGRNMEFPLSEALAALRKKPRLFFLANPNNPTGTAVSSADILKLIHTTTNTVLVLDEAYAEFAVESVVPWVRRYPNLFVVRTFSKAEGLAGLRLGAVIGQCNSLALVRRAMPPYPVNIAALAAAVAAIEERKAIMRYVRDVKRLRVWLTGELEKRNVRVFPSSANFLLADFGEDGPAFFRRLARHNILVRERSKDLGPGFARITIGTPAELRRLLKILGSGHEER